MKILFQDHIIEFTQAPSIEEVIDSINEFLTADFYFSHLRVDGKEITENPEAFLTMHRGELEVIELIAISAREFIDQLLVSGESYTKRAIPQLSSLANDFYSNLSARNWQELGKLFEGIDWLLKMSQTVDQSTKRPANWEEVQDAAFEVTKLLKQLEEALENQDTVLIADLIRYELLPIFETFATTIQTAIDTEGTRDGLN